MSLRDEVLGLEKELQETQVSIESMNAKIKENEAKFIEIKKLKEAKIKIASQLKVLTERKEQAAAHIKEQEQNISKEIDSQEEESDEHSKS